MASHLEHVDVERQVLGPQELSQELLDSLARLRSRVWLGEGVDFEDSALRERWLEPLDHVGYHWVVTARGELVGAARMTLHDDVGELPDAPLYAGLEESFPGPIAALTRQVVCASVRGRGLATRMTMDQLRFASEVGASSVALDCPERRVPFHRRLGFRSHGRPKPGVVIPDVTWRVMGLDLRAARAP